MMRSITLVILATALTAPAAAATIEAPDCSLESVAAAVARAVDGDIVSVPAGVCSWQRTLTIDKAIALEGGGVGFTVIEDSVPTGSTSMHLISMRLKSGGLSRITGFHFRGGARAVKSGVGLIKVEGSNLDGSRLRIDNCRFAELWSLAFNFYTVVGVVDHNEFLLRADDPSSLGAVKSSGWNGANFGDGAWADANGFGTDRFIFFEDNAITYLGLDRHVTVIDAQAGGRYVFRHNTVTRGSIEGHGTESGNRERSTRAVEIYNNRFVGNNKGQIATYFRGGVGVVFGNVITNYQQSNAPLLLLSNRNTDTFAVWGGADGTNPWDKNSAVVFASGAVLSSGTLSMTAASVAWSANQWAGYVLRRTTNLANVTGSAFTEITGNTTDTLTLRSSIFGNIKFTAGDRWEIRRVEYTMDQPGRSGGTQVTGGVPVVPTGWNNQVNDPWYEWDNVRDGGVDVNFGAIHSTIRPNEHYFNNRAPDGYQPFTYPHPLTSAGALAIAPRNLRIVQ